MSASAEKHGKSKTGSFSQSSFTSRMVEMDNSQQSIEVLSLWVQHHRSQAPRAVHTWYRYFKSVADDAKKLQLLYLVNDVVQNSRRRGNEFQEQFSLVIVKAVQHAMQGANAKGDLVKSVRRLLKIWRERRVFDAKVIEQLAAFEQSEAAKSGSKAEKETHAEQQSVGEAESAPSNEELLELLTWLQSAVSNNTRMQAELDGLPAELTNVSKLTALKPDEIARVRNQIDKASELLHSYDERFDAEVKQRRTSIGKLRAFIASQEKSLRKDEAQLAEYRTMLTRVSTTCDELRKHVASLPDVNALLSSIQIPNVTL